MNVNNSNMKNQKNKWVYVNENFYEIYFYYCECVEL